MRVRHPSQMGGMPPMPTAATPYQPQGSSLYGYSGSQAFGSYGMYPQQQNWGMQGGYGGPRSYGYFMPQMPYYNPGYGTGFMGGGTFSNRNYLNPQSAMYRSPSAYRMSNRTSYLG